MPSRAELARRLVHDFRDAAILSGQLQRLRQEQGPVSEIANGIEATDPWGTTVRLLTA